MNEEYAKYIDENGHCELPEGLEKIENCAFWGCFNLVSITIPNSVKSIDACAFLCCVNLMSITIPDSVTSIGDCAFDGCRSLTSINIPERVTSIGTGAFYGCTNLKKITVNGECPLNREYLAIPDYCVIEKTEKAKPLTELSREIHDNAIKHGWWERNVDFPITVALCHAELSEALEEYRSGNPNFYYISNGFKSEDIDEIGEEKPEGVAVEMLDCVIRILDWCGQNGIDVDRLVELKNEYNKTRPYKHGGKVC